MRFDMHLAAPLPVGTLVDVMVASQPGMFSSGHPGTWIQVVETGIVYSDLLFYREPSSISNRNAPESLEVRRELTLHAQFRGRITDCRVCAVYPDHTTTTLVVQPEPPTAGYR